MCGNCCVFPESFFQGNTIQACGKKGVTAEMDWHPEARTDSYSMDHLIHSIKGMSDTPQSVSALRAQSTNNPHGSSVLPSPQPEAEQAMASGSRQPGGLWQQAARCPLLRDSSMGMVSLTKGAEPSSSRMSQQSIVTHTAPPAHNCFGVKDVVSEGNALLQERTCHKGAAQGPPASCFSRPVWLNSTCGVYRSVSNAMSLLRLKFCS